MLNIGYINKILSFQLPPEAEWHSLISNFYSRYNHIHDLIMTEFGPNGFIILFFLFLFLVIIAIIYIKAIMDTFKNGEEEIENPETEQDGLFYSVENPELTLANDNEEDTPVLVDTEENARLKKEQELSTDLILASQNSADYLNLERDYLELKQKMQKHAKNEQQRKEKLIEEIKAQDKTQQEKEDNNNNNNDDDSDEEFSPVAVILNLISHGVSDSKIAQALFFYNKAKMSEQDIINLIATVSDLIGLCNAGKFDFMSPNRPLPPLNLAIIDLARGDPSACLVLLQALLNEQMQKAESETSLIRDLTYAMAANIACIMGNIARLNDIDLAHNSYELATELSPKNVIAWNCLGDIYMQENAKEKAMIAYQNVLDISDRIIYAQQIAHAQKQLADYYLSLGLEAKAKQLHEESSHFYDISGIHIPLSNSENTVFIKLKNDSMASLSVAVNNLLSAHK